MSCLLLKSVICSQRASTIGETELLMGCMYFAPGHCYCNECAYAWLTLYTHTLHAALKDSPNRKGKKERERDEKKILKKMGNPLGSWTHPPCQPWNRFRVFFLSFFLYIPWQFSRSLSALSASTKSTISFHSSSYIYIYIYIPQMRH